MISQGMSSKMPKVARCSIKRTRSQSLSLSMALNSFQTHLLTAICRWATLNFNPRYQSKKKVKSKKMRTKKKRISLWPLF